jgi:hypothetical protein
MEICRTWFLDADNKMEPDSSEVNWFSKFVPSSVRKFRRIEWLAIVEEAQKIANKSDAGGTDVMIEQKIDNLELQIIELKDIVHQLRETVQAVQCTVFNN